MYVRGSNAYQLAELNQTTEATTRQTEAKQAPKKKTAHAKPILPVILLLVVALCNVLATAQANILKNEITALETQYKKAEGVALSSEIELEKSVDLQKIEDLATTELGMQRPENYQKVYITVAREDEATVYKDTTKENTNFFGAIVSAFSSLKEYLF